MDYNAGELDISILAYNKSAIQAITDTTKALNSLANATKKINTSLLTHSGKVIEHLFSKISAATRLMDATSFEKLSKVAKSLSAVGKVGSLEKVDYDKVVAGFNKLAVGIEPFLQRIQSAEASLTSLYGILSKANGKKLQNLLGGANQGNSALFSFAKMGVSIYAMRRLGVIAAQIVESGSDYLETMNLWQVAMRNNIDLAEEFVQKMRTAYGVSAKTTMQAQATFKNMIGSLGDLSDATAYTLSEAITQMAYDYSSLYNVELEQAVDKFQSALAGQVRPIRSISGYDITEKTIHALYRSIGGTKTQRQLSRTEKQLLAILAVFNQMQESGATGDLGKTLNQFANQSRMMRENFAETKAWAGLLLVDLIESLGVMTKINAFLITLSEIIKAVAKSRGVGQKNFIDGIWESAEQANEAVDELQGKLLSFDKFRSLSGQELGADVAIDQVLLNAIGDYASSMGRVTNEAQEIAEAWLKILGFTKDVNGEWTASESKLNAFYNLFKGLLIVISSAFGLAVLASLVKFSNFINMYAIKPIVTLISKLISLLPSITAMQLAFVAMGGAILALSFKSFLETEMSAMKRMITLFVALASAVVAAKIALSVFKGDWSKAIGLGAVVASGVFTVSSAIPNFENGASDIDSGTVFRAGEFGKTEAVYTGQNGKTNVANVRQMEQAFYNALSRYGAEDGGKIVVEAYIDGEKVYQNTTSRAHAHGKTWSNV